MIMLRCTGNMDADYDSGRAVWKHKPGRTRLAMSVRHRGSNMMVRGSHRPATKPAGCEQDPSGDNSAPISPWRQTPVAHQAAAPGLRLYNGELSIEKTRNAGTPAAKGRQCLPTIDVWEHAYYLDYQNDRPKYPEAVLGKPVNWDFAAENFMRAINAGGSPMEKCGAVMLPRDRSRALPVRPELRGSP